MEVIKQNKQVELLDHDSAAQVLTSKGIRPTLHRVQLTQYILTADHPTAEDVLSWANNNIKSISRATVYNTLSDLLSVGLIKEVKGLQKTKVVYDNNLQEHFHFFDLDSGKVFDISPHDINIHSNLSDRFQVEQVEITISGRQKP